MQIVAGAISNGLKRASGRAGTLLCFQSIRFVDGGKPCVVSCGREGAVSVRLDQMVRPVQEIAHNAAIRFVARVDVMML